MTRTVNLAPTWRYAVTIYCAVLENPDASPEAKEAARTDLLRLAWIVDGPDAEPEPEPEPEQDPARWRAEQRWHAAADRDELDLY